MNIQKEANFYTNYMRMRADASVKKFHSKVIPDQTSPELERLFTSLFNKHLKQVQQSLYLPYDYVENTINKNHLTHEGQKSPFKTEKLSALMGSNNGFHITTYALFSLRGLQNKLQSSLSELMHANALRIYKENN